MILHYTQNEVEETENQLKFETPQKSEQVGKMADQEQDKSKQQQREEEGVKKAETLIQVVEDIIGEHEQERKAAASTEPTASAQTAATSVTPKVEGVGKGPGPSPKFEALDKSKLATTGGLYSTDPLTGRIHYMVYFSMLYIIINHWFV